MNIKSSHRCTILWAMILFVPFLLSGWVSNWVLSPRDKSIKKWESRERRERTKEEKSLLKDSITAQSSFTNPYQL
ncbi:MAG: hypothetical protein ACFB0A_06705 [Croceivirga sp.]